MIDSDMVGCSRVELILPPARNWSFWF